MGTKGSKTPHRSTKGFGRMTQSADTRVWRPVSHPQTLNAAFKVHIKHKLKKKIFILPKDQSKHPKKNLFFSQMPRTFNRMFIRKPRNHPWTQKPAVAPTTLYGPPSPSDDSNTQPLFFQIWSPLLPLFESQHGFPKI